MLFRSVKRSCQERTVRYDQYEYCDPLAVTLLACIAQNANATFFRTLGVAGQDCASWVLLTEYLSGISSLADFDAYCSSRRHLGKAGCQEDTTVGLAKGMYAVGGYDYFAVRFKSTQPTPEHLHFHFWNTDSVYDELVGSTQGSMSAHPGFQSCYKNFKWGSTWNRPQVCIQSGQPYWYAGFRVAWATPAQPSSYQYGGTRWPIMNVASSIHGSIELNYVSKGPQQLTECPSQPKPETSGFTLLLAGQWCLFRAVADSFSTGGRSASDRNICACTWQDPNFNNDDLACRSTPCSQYAAC